ncbi:hypothetical protein DF223_14270 [Mycetocola zhujimingii]|uniref:DUF1294 domain-containing protein n=1 Tax=Mycetocola zhujimingii TaxID=2079792 RepID=A0A2U1TAK3_9MICO|nr:hypothetical protein DF223_14270 [Mycetocola zhujimingii]
MAAWRRVDRGSVPQPHRRNRGSSPRDEAGRVGAPEVPLLGLGLGGWPGAIVVQQVLRHKIRKRHFMVVFAGTVVANVGVLVLLASPLGATALCSITGCQ